MENSRSVGHFVGQLVLTLKCYHCGYCSVTLDLFWDLLFPLPQSNDQVRLAQSLKSFTKWEILDLTENRLVRSVKKGKNVQNRFQFTNSLNCLQISKNRHQQKDLELN